LKAKDKKARFEALVDMGCVVCRNSGFADYEAVIAGHCPNEPIEGPLALNLHFGIRIPTSWSKRKKADAVSGFIRPTSRPDIDNYIKAVMDAVNGQAYHDDSQVVSLAASLSYTDSPYVSFKASPV